MVNVNALKGKMREKGITQERLAKLLNLSLKTANSRLKNGIFKTYEVEIICREMNLSAEEAGRIFFAGYVS